MNIKTVKKYQYSDLDFLNGINIYSGKFYTGFIDYIFNDESRDRKIKTAVWYPTMDTPCEILYRDIFPGNVSIEAQIVNLQFPVIIISHGSEGHRFNQYYLAEFMASKGYIVAAVEHPGDNALDNYFSKSIENIWNRPQDISFVINSLFNTNLSNFIDESSIAFAGHSFGGCTGLLLAGAVPNYKKLQNYFSNIKYSSYDRLKEKTLKDPRIKCYFLMAPALSTIFSKITLKKINTPIALIVSDKDEFLQIDNQYYMAQLYSLEKLINFKNAGHYVYLMNCPESIISLGGMACIDIGITREKIHPFIKWHMLQFLSEKFNYV